MPTDPGGDQLLTVEPDPPAPPPKPSPPRPLVVGSPVRSPGTKVEKAAPTAAFKSPAPPKPAHPKPAPAPVRKPTSRYDDDDDEEGGRFRRLARSKWGPRVLIPVAVLAIGFTVYDQALSNPSVDSIVAKGKAAPLPVTHKLTADDMWNQYAANNATANTKFNEVNVELSGKVRKVVSDPRKVAPILETPSSSFGVECTFNTKDEVAGIKPGDQVTVQGEGTYRSKSEANVVLNLCKLRK